MDLIRQHAGEDVINNPTVPNEQNDAVVAEAGHSIIELPITCYPRCCKNSYTKNK